MLNDPKIWGTHLKRHEVVMITTPLQFRNVQKNHLHFTFSYNFNGRKIIITETRNTGVMHLSMPSPRAGGGGWGGLGELGNPRVFNCDVYPQGGGFDHLIFQ